MQNSKILQAIEAASAQQLSMQSKGHWWWYTLEATEYICAEMIFLRHYLANPDLEMEMGLARRILSKQRDDGTWALFYNGEGDLSTTIECYVALKLVKTRIADAKLNDGNSRELSKKIDRSLEMSLPFIRNSGGITKARVFTKIHMALFGIVPWNACPVLPVELMLMPTWSPVNVYEFSSWARSCIIPLLVVMDKKIVRPFLTVKEFSLEELFAEPADKRDWNFKTDKHFLSWERFFINLNKLLRAAQKIPFKPLNEAALKKSEEWIVEHISKTEDIFPALAYSAMALSALGHKNDHPTIAKCIRALYDFQQRYDGDILPALPEAACSNKETATIHQQCCISPVWDTPWQITALLEAGVPSGNDALLKSGRWLISKQITSTEGDWKIKNSSARPGGWSFEFENEYFPDTDDTVQVLRVLNALDLPKEEKNPAIETGLEWLLSMQNDDGGWGAFDRNQNFELVNKVPFSDHGACLDPSSPDIAARVLGIATLLRHKTPTKKLLKAIDYLEDTQTNSGAWSGRWGVNFIYGTWCVGAMAGHVTTLPEWRKELKETDWEMRLKRALAWFESIQTSAGGFSESPESYRTNEYLPYPRVTDGVPSQTAWAIMGMIGLCNALTNLGSPPESSTVENIRRASEFLAGKINGDGTWTEEEYTGTGFPNHFYIRYHGYRHFFPLLALSAAAKFFKQAL